MHLIPSILSIDAMSLSWSEILAHCCCRYYLECPKHERHGITFELASAINIHSNNLFYAQALSHCLYSFIKLSLDIYAISTCIVSVFNTYYFLE
jgi:hypothetical protein